MPHVMMVIISDRVASGRKGANCEGRFRLAHEDAGRDVERFRSARAHQSGHHTRGSLHHQLHDSQVIKHREESRDKDDGRQSLEGKIESSRGVLLAEVAKDEGSAVVSEIQKPVGRCTQLLEKEPAILRPHDQESESNLQTEAPGDCLVANGLAVG